ncbi:MAG: GTPase RsgA, partial [Planctomycetota bacterium]
MNEEKKSSRKALDTLRGKVVLLTARGGIVEVPEGSHIRCELRGAAKKKGREKTHPVAVGDRVFLSITSPGEGVIETVEPRRTTFSRWAPGKRFEQVLAANADAVVAMSATQTPPFRPGLLDRVLVAAEQGGLEGWVCLNKVDLSPVESFEATLS